MPTVPSRRTVLATAALLGVAGCAAVRPRDRPREPGDALRLSARADPSATPSLTPGTSSLALENGEEALLHVPAGELRGLVLSLHGAGSAAAAGLALLHTQADRYGLAVLAPSSRRATWGPITREGDPDTPALDVALAEVLAQHPFTPEQVAVAGFSDGASYALTLALANGDVLPRCVAFSPGFEASRARRGQADFFVTHGVHDPVLPIDRTSRRLVPALRRDGYAVEYREFDGPHVVPPDLADTAAEWLVS